MKRIETTIDDVILFEPTVHGDERGFFMETFRKDYFSESVGDIEFVQENHSKSARNVLRGLHYQLEKPQGKLLRVLVGEVFDVAVDLRRNSSTYGKYACALLSAQNRRQIWVPEGFAHGFLVLSASAEIAYKCSSYYNPATEHSLLWNDPALDIPWPLGNGVQPILSEKDANAPILACSPGY